MYGIIDHKAFNILHTIIIEYSILYVIGLITRCIINEHKYSDIQCD